MKPSERAMQCVYSIRQQAYNPLTVFVNDVRAAELIDAHTAEAVAEYKRVLGEAHKELLSARAAWNDEDIWDGGDKTLAAIEQLTNNSDNNA